MVLLHAFIKKTQKTPQADLDLALQCALQRINSNHTDDTTNIVASLVEAKANAAANSGSVKKKHFLVF